MKIPSNRLANGVMAATPTIAYTGTARYTRVNYMTAYNIGGAQETVIVTITPSGGTARKVARCVLEADEFAELYTDDEPAVLGPGDSMSLQTTNSASVAYYMAGEIA